MNLLDQAKHIPHGVTVISKWLGSGGEVVDQQTAQARADVCLGKNPSGVPCEWNTDGVMLTTAVALAIKQYLSVKNKLGLRVDGERDLKTCAICGCALRLKVHEPQERVRAELTDEEKLTTPEFCWQTKQ